MIFVLCSTHKTPNKKILSCDQSHWCYHQPNLDAKLHKRRENEVGDENDHPCQSRGHFPKLSTLPPTPMVVYCGCLDEPPSMLKILILILKSSMSSLSYVKPTLSLTSSWTEHKTFHLEPTHQRHGAESRETGETNRFGVVLR